MFKLTACGCAAAVSASALAQPLTGVFAWQVSADGGSTWSSSITLNPGDPYKIRALAGWTDGPNPSVGFAGATFEQIDLIGADSSDIFGGASGPDGVPDFLTRRQSRPETWTLQAGSGVSALGLKIDNLNPLARTNLGQIQKLPVHFPNPDFDASNPMLLLALDAVAGSPKTLTISSTWTRLGAPATNEFKIYTSDTGTNKKPLQEAVRTDAVVTIIPAPASPTLLALLALTSRRSRSQRRSS